MRDAIYETEADRITLVPLTDDPQRWPFPMANQPDTWVEISQETEDHLLGCLPPMDWQSSGFLVGEASTTDHRFVTVYTRVQRAGGKFWARDIPRDMQADAIAGLYRKIETEASDV